MRITVCLMLKAPRPGEVKTRLGRDTGMNEACSIYRRLAEHQLAQVPSKWQVEVHYSPATECEQMKAWLGKGLVYIAQAEGDLGDRLRLAAQKFFGRKARAILFLGGDCPDVTKMVLEQAATQLEAHDIVLGPATDGGYYLIAMKNFYPRLFEQIDWSTERVLAQTKERIQELGLRSFLLPAHSDVDDLASLRVAQKAHAFLR